MSVGPGAGSGPRLARRVVGTSRSASVSYRIPLYSCYPANAVNWKTAVARKTCNGQGATEEKTFLLIFNLGLKRPACFGNLIFTHHPT
ncbi:Hypothetical predicted protein [Marmota monax]|uniref:Uncharacterized protein n=1 Tax=Marmota monax TaxID=9995 RepID=A0A5E4A2C0_MARMO|nr:hypothetical protein GHT09_001155 [Marmota monax]VTJ51189.1 Hypothetical predicted protein [Marmota monax]